MARKNPISRAKIGKFKAPQPMDPVPNFPPRPGRRGRPIVMRGTGINKKYGSGQDAPDTPKSK